MSRGTARLALVRDSDRDALSGSMLVDALARRLDTVRLEVARLERILGDHQRVEGALAAWSDQSEPDPTKLEVPLCIQLTVKQILEVADDAELRADFLQLSSERIPLNVWRRTASLDSIALDLRRVADAIERGWESH